MNEYIGLDVSLKDTTVSMRRDGQRVWRGTSPSDPKLLAELIRKRAPNVVRVVFETGPLSTWFYHSLREEGLPAICIDARHAKAAWIWLGTRPMRMMRMDWHTSPRPAFTGKCG